MRSALVIPCHIRTEWDLGCLFRLLDSVRDQATPFSHVYVVVMWCLTQWPNKTLKLTGAAITVSRGKQVLQAAPAA